MVKNGYFGSIGHFGPSEPLFWPKNGHYGSIDGQWGAWDDHFGTMFILVFNKTFRYPSRFVEAISTATNNSTATENSTATTSEKTNASTITAVEK